jgi:Zn-dependent protease with chaperone function
MLWVARIVGLILGLIIGVIVDEALFPDTEWTSAVTPLLFAILGWGVATFLVRRLSRRAELT